MKWYWKQLLIIFGTVLVFFITGYWWDIDLMWLDPSDWIQLVASVMSVFAFFGLLVQIYIQNVQRKSEKRPHWKLSFKSWVQEGDIAVSMSNSWGFDKYYRGMAAVKTIDSSVAIDAFFVATYESKGDRGVIKDYLYLAGVGRESYSLDFKHGRGFQKLEIYFKSSVEELGKVTLHLSGFKVAIPQYIWGRELKKEYKRVSDETSKALAESKTNFSIYRFDENDLKTARKYNTEKLKRYVVKDAKTEAINYYLYGNPNGRVSDKKK